MSKERELLARAGLVIAQYRWSHPEDQALHQLSHQINEYLEENPQHEPIAYWDTQEGKLIPAMPLSSERTCFKVPLVPLYLHPTPHPFVRLTDEEIKTLADSGLSPDWTDEFEIYHFVRSVEDALEEKNK
jgi:hypothetical protein